MKQNEAQTISRAIAAAIPGLYGKGRLVAVTPRKNILRGLYLESSSEAAKAYVWTFVQPLYVPESTFVFTVGHRLGGGTKTWSATDTALLTTMREEGVPFFTPLATPEALAKWLEGRTNLHEMEARAYSLIASGQFIAGIQALRDLARSLPDHPAWMIEMRKRAELLASHAESNPTAALEQLAMWEAGTVAALRIQDIP